MCEDTKTEWYPQHYSIEVLAVEARGASAAEEVVNRRSRGRDQSIAIARKKRVVRSDEPTIDLHRFVSEDRDRTVLDKVLVLYETCINPPYCTELYGRARHLYETCIGTKHKRPIYRTRLVLHRDEILKRE